MRCLVTGAAGFIGSHLAERLMQDGHTVLALDNFSPYYSVAVKRYLTELLKKQGVMWYEKDLRTADLEEICSNIDAIFHLAAQPGIAPGVLFDAYVDHNVLATERLLKAAIKTKAFFVNIATSSVYGSLAIGDENAPPAPVSYYGVSKVAAEQLVLSYVRKGVLRGCSLRPFSVFGERERPEKMFPQLIMSILREKPFSLFKGSRDHVRSFTYVGDIVEACVRVLEARERCNAHIINLGNEETFTTGRGIELVEELMGKKAYIIEAPAREGDQQETRAQIAKARQLLGFEPTTDLPTSLAKEITWFKEHLALYV